MTPEFVPWPKIHRFRRNVVITEKIDGTNAAVGVTDDGDLYCQSRKRIITPESDNFGFAQWAHDNRDELVECLGPGLHFGEWYGLGIQRGYGLDEKRFALFNVQRWQDAPLPERVDVVPVLSVHTLSDRVIDECLSDLAENGSRVAAPGWEGRPEGIVVYLPQANTSFKITLDNDEQPKSVAERAMIAA